MKEETKATIMNAAITRAMITCMGMQAENNIRIQQGHSLAYTDADFFKVIDQEGISHNNVLDYLKE